MNDLLAAMKASSSGMQAQSARVRILSENVANAQTTADTPEGDPYRRKLVDFEGAVDEATGANTVEVERVYEDEGKLPLKYDPDHRAADENGYVKMPNVDPLVEMMDMREASRSHQASMKMFDQARQMISGTISLMRK